MTREQKCIYALEKGFYYNAESGLIYNKHNRVYKNKHTRGYIVISLFKDKKEYRLLGHHFAWYFIYNEVVDCLDHINRVTSDNRIINLRSVSKQENCFNKECKGFYYSKKDKRFVSQIRVNNKQIYLGSFMTEQEANESYKKAKEKYHIISNK